MNKIKLATAIILTFAASSFKPANELKWLEFNEGYALAQKTGKIMLVDVYTDWCGFSQKAMPEWEKLEAQLSKTSYFGKTHVTPVRVDAEEDRETATLYEVDAYPTIFLETKNGITEYTKRPTTEGLLQFLRQSLGKETESV